MLTCLLCESTFIDISCISFTVHVFLLSSSLTGTVASQTTRTRNWWKGFYQGNTSLLLPVRSILRFKTVDLLSISTTDSYVRVQELQWLVFVNEIVLCYRSRGRLYTALYSLFSTNSYVTVARRYCLLLETLETSCSIQHSEPPDLPQTLTVLLLYTVSNIPV